jgi:hypothetical protein
MTMYVTNGNCVDQDALGRPAVKVDDSSPGGLQWTQVWARPLANGDVAALMFNRGSWGGCVACKESVHGCACQGLQFDLPSRFRPPGTVLGAQEIFTAVNSLWEIFTAVNPHGKYFLGPDNIPGGRDRARRFDQIGVALNDTRFSATAKVSVRFVWNHTTAPGIYSNNKFPAINDGADARLAPHESLLVRLRIVNGSEPATDW